MAVGEGREYQTNGLRLHVVWWDNAGSGAAPLLLLHGLGESWHTFAALAPRLARTRPVCSVDLRGHGASDKPMRGYGLQDYAADVRGIIEQQSHHPVHLLGHSLGALIALQVAAAHPACLARLVLEDPVFPLTERQQAQAISGLEQWLALKGQPFAMVVEALRPQYPSLARAWVEQLSRDLLATADGPFLALRNGEVLPWEQVRRGMADLLSRVTVPMLVLAGDPLVGGMMGPEQRELLRTVLPAARLIDFPDCGHHLEAASPEPFIAHVEAFLANSY